LLPMLFVHDLVTSTICLSAGFFFIEMTIGPMWAIPMDIAPAFSGIASGLMNTGSALAAIVSPLAFGLVIDQTGDWSLPFIGTIGLMLAGTVAAFWMRPDRKFSVTDIAWTVPVPVR
jgi:MFS transporter, ACS family, glucarate transporter